MLCYACCVRHLGFGSLQPNRVSLPILEVSTNMRLYGICSASPLLSSGAALSSGSAEQHTAFASPTVIGISGRGVLQAGDHSPQVVERPRRSCSVVSVLDRAEDDAGVVDDA